MVLEELVEAHLTQMHQSPLAPVQMEQRERNQVLMVLTEVLLRQVVERD